MAALGLTPTGRMFGCCRRLVCAVMPSIWVSQLEHRMCPLLANVTIKLHYMWFLMFFIFFKSINQYWASWILQVMGSCHLQQRQSLLSSLNVIFTLSQPSWDLTLIFSGGDSLCLPITGWAHESHYQRCGFLAVMVIYRKETCVVIPAFYGKLPAFLTSAC